MNMREFVKALTMTEINELANAIHDVRKDYARQNCKPLNAEEETLAKEGQYILAIKTYRIRNESGLFEAKIAVDSFLGR